MYLSVIIPLYNEAENVRILHEKLQSVLKEQAFSYEIIYVDDGSKDATCEQLRQLDVHDQHVEIVQLSRNFGQTAALAAGVAQSRGRVLVFMDGDLQNDPVDIPRLLAKLHEGYDVVSGWRKRRKDAQLSRKLPSWLANHLISKVTGVHLHDYGCTLKAYRKEIFQHMRLYGEMHRFLPAYAALAGAAITEIEVAHHPRRFGVSKYGISRTVRVILDLMTVKFLGRYGTKTLYAFGIPGLLTLLLGAVLFIITVGTSFSSPIGTTSSQVGARFSSPAGTTLPPSSKKADANRAAKVFLQPSLYLSGFGIQCIMLGLIAELLMRTYYESQGKAHYVIKNVFSLPEMNAMDQANETYEDEISVKG
jgi:glycosyltransferase involved in cell wall biosynthesis